MSNTDSFIDEVSEEVRRDRLFRLMRRYGWIAVAAVVLIVGGAAYNEYRKARAEDRAQALGDATLAALEADAPAERASALATVAVPDDSDARAVISMLRAAEAMAADNPQAASDALSAIATDGSLPQMYRDLASFKALLVGSETLSVDERRLGFEALAKAGNPLRLLAEEQLALIDVDSGNVQAALNRLRALLQDAELTNGLRNRATQLIVALGGSVSEEAATSAGGTE